MSSVNIARWVKKNANLAKEPVLEIGALRVDEFVDIRSALPHLKDFTGCDLQAGENVDVVVDIASDFSEIEQKLEKRRFHTIYCMSVLEHIPDVFLACRNIDRLLMPRGVLFLSVPFVFRFHAYPGDYWRFTPEAVLALFPHLNFQTYGEKNVFASLTPGDVKQIPEDLRRRNRFIFRPKERSERVERKALKREAPERVQGDYSLAPTMVNMIGVKEA